MAKVNPEEHGSSRPKVTWDDLEEDAAILTIKKAEMVEVDDDDQPSGKRRSLTLQFEETGDKVIWTNKTQVEALVAALGDESDDWLGQPVPVEKITTQYRNQSFKKVAVCPVEAWADLFESAGLPLPSRLRRRTVKPEKQDKPAGRKGRSALAGRRRR